MTLIVKYLELQEEYSKKLGTDTVVLIQEGSFYNAYEYDPNNCINEEYKTHIERPGKLYDQKIGIAVTIGDILDYEITHKDNSKPYSVKNPNLVGINMAGYEGCAEKILANNINIVLVEQVNKNSKNYDPSDPDLIIIGKLEPRKVTQIRTPGTEMENCETNRNSNFVSIYIEYQKGRRLEDFTLICGISSIDVTTGSNNVSEMYSSDKDNTVVLQEINRYLLAHQPREILINVVNLPKDCCPVDGPHDNKYAKFLRTRLKLSQYQCVNIFSNSVDNEYRKLSYHRHILQNIFFPMTRITNSLENISLNSSVDIVKKSVSDNILQRLGLDRMNYGRISYILLLQHCQSNSSKTIELISKPNTKWLDGDKHLTLTHNSLEQLNIISINQNVKHCVGNRKKKTITCLLDVLDCSETKMGSRLLQERLYNPLTDCDELENNYKMIAEILSLDVVLSDKHNEKSIKSFLDHIKSRLRGLPDLERYQRLLLVKKIKPKELAILIKSYINCCYLYTDITTSTGTYIKKLLLSSDKIENFNKFLNRVSTFFNLQHLECCRLVEIDDNDIVMDFTDQQPIIPGNIPDIDKYQSQLQQSEDQLRSICNYLNGFLTGTRGKLLNFLNDNGKVKKKKSDDDRIHGITIITTAAKAKKLEVSYKSGKIDTRFTGNLNFITVKSGIQISSNVIDKLCTTVEDGRTHFRKLLSDTYFNFINELIENYNFYDDLINFVAMIDFIHIGGQTARDNNYYQPTISRTSYANSFLKITNLRHPIIEKLISTPYVTNDITLGKDKPDDLFPHGILLYGANATGKSSLTKALGLAIVMAQAGLYTAGNLTYSPYYRIVTRLSGNDDLIKSQSSYMIEMEELRIILRNGGSKTLVLGDELTRGTETESGSAITIATMEQLVKSKSSFIFSTHMHHVAQTDYIRSLSHSLSICHLSIEFNTELDELTIGRKLLPGSGSTNYGIEIAKALGLEQDFLKRAGQIRQEMYHKTSGSAKTTRYNSSVYKDLCLICNKEESIHTHHLIPQQLAKNNGIIAQDGQVLHKDIASNLVSLCESCHISVHKGNLVMTTYQTVDGYTLLVRQAR